MKMFTLMFSLLALTHSCVSACVSDQTDPSRCELPEFINAAFGKNVEATNACEVGAQFCDIQTGTQCSTCSSAINDARKMTDADISSTWWQSQTMAEGVQDKTVNITLDLGKNFTISYVTIRFKSPKPESFALYRKVCDDCPWTPYQYYSAFCQSTYGLASSSTPPSLTQPGCRDEFSDITPLTGSSISFSTLEGRVALANADMTDAMFEWTMASAIRISLKSLNTFGEPNPDEITKRTYYYAISDFSIGGRCFCNGHADKCNLVDGRLTCVCQHNTDGQDCRECKVGYTKDENGHCV